MRRIDINVVLNDLRVVYQAYPDPYPILMNFIIDELNDTLVSCC